MYLSNTPLLLAQLETKQAKLTEKGKDEKAAALDERITLARELAKQRKIDLDRATKGILLVELTRYTERRNAQLRRMLGQFSALQIASAVRVKSVWETLIERLSVDADEADANAKEIVAGNHLPPLPYTAFNSSSSGAGKADEGATEVDL